MVNIHWYEAIVITIGVVGTFLLCVGVKVAFDSLNDLVYGEETMNMVLNDYPSKQEEGY